MDGSAFSHFPVTSLMVFAVIGLLATAAAFVSAVAWIAWFLFTHVQLV